MLGHEQPRGVVCLSTFDAGCNGFSSIITHVNVKGSMKASMTRAAVPTNDVIGLDPNSTGMKQKS